MDDDTEDTRPEPPRFEDVDPDGLVEVGGSIARVKVSLRMFGDELDPDEITDHLGCEPTVAYRKGQTIPTGRYQRRASTGSWLLEGTQPEEEDLEAQVLALLSRVSSDESVWRRLTDQFDADIFCGVFLGGWNEGFALSSLVTGELARRGLRIDFDIYSGGSDAE